MGNSTLVGCCLFLILQTSMLALLEKQTNPSKTESSSNGGNTSTMFDQRAESTSHPLGVFVGPCPGKAA